MSVAVENVSMALEDSVVWYNLKIRGYPRWPCKVTSSPDSEGKVGLETFEDHQEYTERSDNLTPFIHADIGKSCAKDAAKCQRRPATLDQYKRAIREAIAFLKSKDPYFCPPSELEEVCGPTTHLLTPAAIRTQDVASLPTGLSTSSTRKRPSSGACMAINQSPLCEKKKEDNGSPECKSKKRRTKPSGTPGSLWSRDKGLADGSPIPLVDLNTNPPNSTSDSCSARPGGDGGCVASSGLTPSCGAQPPHSVGSEGTERKLTTDHVNGKGSAPQSSSSANGGSFHTAAASVSTEGSENSDDDILPSIDMTPQRCIRVKNLKGGDIIWAKYGRFPFWPAMVTSVNKNKKRAVVAFLGWSENEGRIGIPNKNIAPFNYLHQELYLQQGRASQWAEMFSLAFEEANTLVREALPGTLAEQLMSVIAHRPKNKQYVVSPMAELCCGFTSDGLGMSAEEEKDSDEDNDENLGDMNTIEGDSSSDEEQVSPEYRYDILKEKFEMLKPELLAIVEGRLPSELHTAYCHGSQQQRRAMTRSVNFGPARKLPTKQQTQLLSFLETIIDMATTEQRFGHKYCCEVLFPEAMIRVIAKTKGVSPQEAANEVLQEMEYL